jgi:hypothetical protein
LFFVIFLIIYILLKFGYQIKMGISNASRLLQMSLWIPRSKALKEMSQGSKSHSAPSIPKYFNYFPY